MFFLIIKICSKFQMFVIVQTTRVFLNTCWNYSDEDRGYVPYMHASKSYIFVC